MRSAPGSQEARLCSPGPGPDAGDPAEGPAMRTTLASVLALITLTACGGGDDEAEAQRKADEKAAIASIAQYWEDTGIAADKADCLGTDLVEVFGVPHLQDLEILDDKLETSTTIATGFTSAADAPKAATVIVDCLTLPGIMAQQYQLKDDAVATCIADAYGRDRMIEAMALQMQGKPAGETPAEVTTAMEKCVEK